ncbi:MAG TPA: nucleotidyltransferase domain-containing protein [Candidatus Nanoarchaeia archaeon]|nr:nucleotidyltransferase domain-containing protein [Candidatus Nanoarchaeia archaeon]
MRRSENMLPKPLQQDLEFQSKAFFSKYNEKIIDIFIFGSVVKSEDKPNDLDILIVFKKNNDLKLVQEFRKILESKVKLKVEVTGKSYPELFVKTFVAREAILTEAYSLVNKVGFSEGLGFKSIVMFNYQLKGKTKSERMRFYYSLYGRGSTGMLERLNAVKYADTIILCPVDNLVKMREFLNSWSLEFKETPLLIPSRLTN